MKQISVLGCGWLGEPLAETLILKNFEVKGSITSTEKINRLSEKGIEAFQIVLNSEFEGNPVFFESEILLINIPPKAKTLGETFHINQIKAVLENCKNSKNLKKIIFVSSTSVYPNLDKNMREEEADSEHFLVKIENSIREFAEMNAMKYLILRFGGLMGYDRNPCKYFSNATSDDHSRVNYLHRDDAIGSILSLIDENIWNETLNILSPEHPSRSQIWQNCVTKSDNIINKPKISSNKVVSSERFLSISKYQFLYPDPLAFKYL